MDHIRLTFSGVSADTSDTLIALLAGVGFDGFEEKDADVLAYIRKDRFDAEIMDSAVGFLGLPHTVEVVPEQNWNQLWESNFEPVIVGDFCTVRAHFHNIAVTTPYEILITPKMSFGTGHHATTRLVMQTMRGLDFSGKSVLDFGTGTGVLAILAEMLGATGILAIDNDDWSVENAIENVQANNCTRIQVAKASIGDIPVGTYDIILANINRHILLENMREMAGRLNPGGCIIMSGILEADREIIAESAAESALFIDNQLELNGWMALLVKPEMRILN